MLESVLPNDILIIILSLLDELSLRNYDTAICNKEYRRIFLESLKSVTYIHANEWSYIRNINNKLQMCYFSNIKYVSDVCIKLIVNNKNNTYYPFCKSRNYNIDIVNHNIKYLHVDLGSPEKNKYILSSIEGNNLLELVLCYVNYIKIDLLENLHKTCPILQKVKVIFSTNIDINRISNIFRECKIDLYVKEKNLL